MVSYAVVLAALTSSASGADFLLTVDLPGGFDLRGLAVGVVGDTDGDGYGDVAIASAFRVDLYRGGPDGPSTEPAVTIPVADDSVVYGIIKGQGDVNADGFADLATHVYGWFGGEFHQIEVRYGSASGVSEEADLVFERAHGAVFADVDGDGIDDLVLGDPSKNAGAGQIAVHQGSPAGLGVLPSMVVDGTTADGQLGENVSAGDVNGDGFADVIGRPSGFAIGGPNDTLVFLGSPSGLGTPPQVLRDAVHPWFVWLWEDSPSVAEAVDLDGDGFDEVVLSTGAVFKGGPLGASLVPHAQIQDGLPPAVLLNYAVHALGDVDGTGMEAVAFSTGDGVAIAQGGTPPRATGFTGGERGNFCDGGDVDGDGLADMLCGNDWSGEVVLMAGGPQGPAFATPTVWPFEPAPHMGQDLVALGDVNGDGFEDVAVLDGEALGEPVTRVYLGSSTGLEADPVVTWEGGEYGYGGVGDVNGDGIPDLALVVDDHYDDRVQIHLGDPMGPTASPMHQLGPPDVGGDGPKVLLGDANGDGFDDLATTVDTSGMDRLGVFYGSAAGLSPTPDLVGPKLDVFPRIWADVDGDGFDDLVLTRDLAQPAGTTVVVLVASGGAGGLGVPVELLRFPASLPWFAGSLQTGDWNGDGYDDVSFNTQDPFVLFGSAAGLDAGAPQSVPGLLRAVTSDVTGDGIDDLLVLGDVEEVWMYPGMAAGFGAAPPDVLDTPKCADGREDLAVADVNGDGVGELVLVCDDPDQLYSDGVLRVYTF